jgi:hypothetical protein
MVDGIGRQTNQMDGLTSNSPLQVAVIEQRVVSKSGRPEECEDLIYLGSQFIAVIDGSTAKTTRRWNGEAPGRVAARMLMEALTEVPSDATLDLTIEILTERIHRFYHDRGIVGDVAADPVQRLTASLIILSLFRKEIWLIGDCQCLLDDSIITNIAIGDRLLADVRAMYLESELIGGVTVEQLQRHDTGRENIRPLLERHMRFQNNDVAAQYAYAAIDGFPVLRRGIKVYSVTDAIRHIVLATDGYPVLMPTLDEAEEALHELLRLDPLLFRKFRSTKGVMPGNVSFDDRAFVRLHVMPAPAKSDPPPLRRRVGRGDVAFGVTGLRIIAARRSTIFEAGRGCGIAFRHALPSRAWSIRWRSWGVVGNCRSCSLAGPPHAAMVASGHLPDALPRWWADDAESADDLAVRPRPSPWSVHWLPAVGHRFTLRQPCSMLLVP